MTAETPSADELQARIDRVVRGIDNGELTGTVAIRAILTGNNPADAQWDYLRNLLGP